MQDNFLKCLQSFCIILEAISIFVHMYKTYSECLYNFRKFLQTRNIQKLSKVSHLIAI